MGGPFLRHLMSDTPIKLIIGLGNPGSEHREDRHNAGYWFVDALARKFDGQFRPERRFSGELARIELHRHDVRLLKPDTFMNRSGTAVQALSAFLKIAPEEILVAHDELDLSPGTVRLKRGGGAGGHNGLRDTIGHIGPDFARLRIGIGHPGEASMVTSYVLRRPPPDERELIDQAIKDAVASMGLLLGQGFERAMHKLHSRGKQPKPYRKVPAKDAGAGADAPHTGAGDDVGGADADKTDN